MRGARQLRREHPKPAGLMLALEIATIYVRTRDCAVNGMLAG
jgi:hypothetical protein